MVATHVRSGAAQTRGLRQFLKGIMPSTAVAGVRAVQTVWEQRLYRPGHFAVWMRDYCDRPASVVAPGQSRLHFVRALLGWLARAQDVVAGGGVSGYYTFASGWSAAYPETTGYVITTLLEAARRLKEQEWADRARRMLDWELSVQLPNGSWQSGFVDQLSPVPAVFNTGQVIDGLVAGYAHFKNLCYLDAALKGARWLIAEQESDGAWRRYVYQNNPNCYSTRVAWPMLMLAQVTGDTDIRASAIRYLSWAATCQDESGWFDHCSLEPGDPALTHTLGYTIEGFLESGLILKEDRWVSVAQRAADVLLHKFEIRKHLAGTYGKGWKPDHSFACLTGCAQISRVWGRFYDITRDLRYLNGMLKLNDYVLSQITLDTECVDIRGGVTGSKPVWGAYMPYRLPNWAAKFTLDALFQEEDAMTLFRKGLS
jgi:hypothetical protein